jgi:T3SS (YopN, CesT) and YbjN peptide-binding chaperone 1/T3SS (YopN, CesT) and YbjN peptide-binding chaperone 3/TY-Chap C-terminal domain
MEFAEFAEFDLDRSTARAWSRFQARLADHLAAMSDDDVLIVRVDAGDSGGDGDAKSPADGGEASSTPFLQFSAWGDGHLRSEVSSNEYLAPRYTLDAAGEGTLQSLGWAAPTSPGSEKGAGTGSTNFVLDVDRSEADRLAVMSVKALRGVFGVAHPAFLAAQNLGATSDKPELGIPSPVIESIVELEEPLAVIPDDVDHLRSLVDSALEPVFGHGPQHDSDGDIPVVAGSALLFIRVLDDAPAIEIFSTIVRGITDLDAAAVAVAELNNGIRMIKFVLVEDVIIAVAHVAALPFAPQQLRGVLDYMSRVADGVDDGLVASVGGRRAFGDDPVEERVDDPADSDDDEGADLPPELLTLLHLDPDGESAIEPDLAASVCNYDRDLVLKLLKISSQEEIAWRQSYDEAAMKGDRDEAAASDAEAVGWAKTVETLRQALRVIVERNRQ